MKKYKKDIYIIKTQNTSILLFPSIVCIGLAMEKGNKGMMTCFELKININSEGREQTVSFSTCSSLAFFFQARRQVWKQAAPFYYHIFEPR